MKKWMTLVALIGFVIGGTGFFNMPMMRKTNFGLGGGSMDVQTYYGMTRATITVASPATGAGQTNNFPATLGAITVNGEVIVPALTVNELTNGGGSSATSANIIRNMVTAGFTASRSSNVVTITAPNTTYAGMAISVADGSESLPLVNAAAAVPDRYPTALIRFIGTTANTAPGATIDTTLAGGNSVTLGGVSVSSSIITIGQNVSSSTAGLNVSNAIGTGGTIKAYRGGNTVTPICQASSTSNVCLVNTASYGSANNGAAPAIGTVTLPGAQTVTLTAAAGGTVDTPAIPKSGWTNFKPAITVTNFDNGLNDATILGDTCNGGKSSCTYKESDHGYNFAYKTTGINFLNPSNPNHAISKYITSSAVQFKVLASNQYLSPAVKLHIGDASYSPSSSAGYINIKDFMTSATLDLATIPTYVNAATATAPVLPIGSFAINLPTDSMAAKNWWGNGDVRAGLHPTEAGCVFGSASAPVVTSGVLTTPSQDGNMYRPVVPPVNGVDGPGTAGWSGATDQTTATGLRHNGALTFQVIKDTTPNSAIEQAAAGRPEYGWRVKASETAKYVLGEHTVFWHSKHLGLCYQDANVTFTLYGVTYTNVSWKKAPIPDSTQAPQLPAAPGATDPNIR